MSLRILVRKSELKDVDILVRFNLALAKEIEGKDLSQTIVTDGVRAVVEDPARGFYLVAETGDTPAGSLLVTTEWSDWRNGWFWWVQSVYVEPSFRRRGIYRALYAKVKELAAARDDVRGIRLYTGHRNNRAHIAYRSLGMRETDYRIFEELL